MFKFITGIVAAFVSFNTLSAPVIKPLQFEEVTTNIFLVKSFREFKNLKSPDNPIVIDANSLIYIDGKDAYLIDTPWNAENMPQLMTWIENRDLTLKKTVFTHFHEDQTGGLEYLQEHGFDTYATKLTNTLLVNDNKKAANHELDAQESVLLDNKIEVFYPGPGHSKDNSVVWFPKEKVLLGGCLMRANEVDTIGWTGDADLAQWAQSAKNVLIKYPETKLVIPGHGDIGKGTSVISHTVNIAESL
ncbi:ALI family subclass B1 metallo-beta-lactamase [Aliivibrio fischeri]|uniref:beta-lactamase n=1 Tax=Aliivibrio fischeri TaxID=668 RepID=A0A510UD56_ALIFS|nr:ALI family subclass B1 metallo-beta-lactamase [Aliivibrio fischeri]GEK12522.1 hypothetical protein AFI02nite_05580 [Aliivibrio fischeri]